MQRAVNNMLCHTDVLTDMSTMMLTTNAHAPYPYLQSGHLSPKHAVPGQQADVVRLFVVIGRPLHPPWTHDGVGHAAPLQGLFCLALPRQHAPKQVERACAVV